MQINANLFVGCDVAPLSFANMYDDWESSRVNDWWHDNYRYYVGAPIM